MKAGCLAASLAICILLASPAAALGTEQAPELIDAEGDIAYNELYLGPRDHHYVDIHRAWFSYNHSTDKVGFTLRVGDSEPLENPARDWAISCESSGELWGADQLGGRVVFRWTIAPVLPPSTPAVASHVSVSKNIGSSGVPRYESGIPVDHDFEPTYADPGYFEYYVMRSALTLHGDEVRSLATRCIEHYYPAGFSAYENEDDALADAVFVLGDLRPVARASESEEAPGMDSSDSSPTSESSSRIPTPGILAAIFAGVGVSWARRNRESNLR